ncbi:MAG: MTH938/NDUFAF3 family protein [Proteobacteria bacterium]|nr:MTH938/NDUFAF3 family protein [Pseudomonadota bacterium]MDA0993396.1 MTH938/NDUFAF3 family protein [Pseudomonadota bacterium]
MKFVRDPGSMVTVRHVEKGKIRIGNEELTRNVVLFRDTIQRGWQAADTDKPGVHDLEDLLKKNPEMIIYGTGWKTCLPPRELVFALARRGIGFEMMDTPAACRTFNVLVGEDRDVAAVLIIE